MAAEHGTVRETETRCHFTHLAGRQRAQNEINAREAKGWAVASLTIDTGNCLWVVYEREVPA